MFLHLNISCAVKWNNYMSRVFNVPTGTKQGGILWPDFFAMYMHNLIELLKASGFGCYIIQICIACIFSWTILCYYPNATLAFRGCWTFVSPIVRNSVLTLIPGSLKSWLWVKNLPTLYFAPSFLVMFLLNLLPSTNTWVLIWRQTRCFLFRLLVQFVRFIERQTQYCVVESNSPKHSFEALVL